MGRTDTVLHDTYHILLEIKSPVWGTEETPPPHTASFPAVFFDGQSRVLYMTLTRGGGGGPEGLLHSAISP